MKAAGRPDGGYRRGVGAVLFGRDGRVFVAQRRDQDSPAWQLPQGGIDGDESPREALLRELAEEIGTGRFEVVGETDGWLTYDLPPAIAARIWGGRYRGQTQKWFALRFTGCDSDIDLASDGHPEFVAWKWVPVEDLPALAVDFKRELYRELTRRFRPLAGASQR